MSDHFDLGVRARPLLVRLHTGAHFTGVLSLVDRDWGEGAAVELRFPDSADVSTWPATVVGAVAEWAVAPALTDAVPDGARVELWVTAGGVSQVWASGKVVRA